MYDNICKFLAEEFPSDLATWLLGEPIVLTKLSPKELSVEPLRTDSLILLQSPELLLHTEFQTLPRVEIPLRMADYRLRGYRRYPEKQMRQIVIYLKQTQSPLVYQNTFTLPNFYYQFEVIRLWEQPTEPFLEAPGLLPFAALTQTQEKATVLREVARRVETIEETRMQSNIAASASILAGLVLEEDLIRQVLRRDIMEESVIYQSLRREALEEGLQQGLQQGREEGREEGLQQGIQQVAYSLLRSGMTVEQVAGFTGLSLETLERLQQLPDRERPNNEVSDNERPDNER